MFVCKDKICVLKGEELSIYDQNLEKAQEPIKRVSNACAISGTKFAVIHQATLGIYDEFKLTYKMKGINSNEKCFSGESNPSYPHIQNFKLTEIQGQLVLLIMYETGLSVYLSISTKSILFKKVSSEALSRFSLGKRFLKAYEENNQIFALSDQNCLAMTVRNSRIFFNTLTHEENL